MSLLPRYATATPYDGGFRSLFRMMDDLATNYESGASGATSTAIRAFSPRFDVVENKDSYQLHGELPGLDQKDVSIEFTDPHTLVIKGRTETHYESDHPDGQGDNSKGKITDVSHKPTVEDEEAEKAKETSVATTSGQQSNGNQQVGQHHQQHHHKTKYWVSERSVGEFHRSFSFPSRVDQDAVKASLKQGILTITVPKLAASKGSKKINIESSD